MTKAFLSDARGNLIQINEQREPTLIFEYDADNNMIGAEVNGTNWTFRYDSQNQMYYSKITFDSGVIDERFYIYDGLDCIAETDVDGTILREYIRIGNTGGIVAEIRHNDPTCAPGYQSGTFYYHYNHRGDVIAVSEHNGGIIFKADYDAYGKIVNCNSSIVNFSPRYTFSTKRFFKELGLYYYGYRWYLPELGRWTTPDPISFYGGTCNFSKFCNNNPIILLDLFGLCVSPHDQDRLDSFIDPKDIDNVFKEGMESWDEDGKEGVEDYFSENPRYAYNEDLGWIDMQHVVCAAGVSQGSFPFAGQLLGDGVEMYQLLNSINPFVTIRHGLEANIGLWKSAFSFEDLISNAIGDVSASHGKMYPLKFSPYNKTYNKVNR